MEFADLPLEPIEHHSLQDLSRAANQGDGLHGPRVFGLGDWDDSDNLPLCYW